MPKGSVKVMRSYDYCHFEVCLSSDENMTLEQVDAMRKEAARLVDKAVEQYIIKKAQVSACCDVEQRLPRLQKEVQIIEENYPKSEWTPGQEATIKALEDLEYRLAHDYDYQDDWEFDF